MAESVNKRLNKNNLPSFLNSRDGWGKLFEIKRSIYPHLHQIEPTNHCPYNCIMCPRGEKMNRNKGFMEFDVFRKVMDEVATYPNDIKSKEIELFHFGESLLNPQITEMNRYATELGLNTVLSVNAIELTHDIAEQLILGNASKIIVSLDGFDAISFQQIRGRMIDYQQAVENIVHTSSLVNSLKSKTKLCVRMIGMNINAHQTEKFKNFWLEKSINAEIRQFFPWTEKDLTDLGEYEKYPPFMPCPFSWQYLAIQWNGDVVTCCRDYNAENKMGNIKELSLFEIWNGNKYKTFRENMVKGTYSSKLCNDCMDIFYTEAEKF